MLVAIDKNVIFNELQLDNLPDEQKESVWSVMLDIFQTRIVERVLFLLSQEEDKRQFLIFRPALWQWLGRTVLVNPILLMQSGGS